MSEVQALGGDAQAAQSSEGDSAPQVTKGDVWGHLWSSGLRCNATASSGWGPGMLINTPGCPGWHPTESDSAPQVNSGEGDIWCTRAFHSKNYSIIGCNSQPPWMNM